MIWFLYNGQCLGLTSVLKTVQSPSDATSQRAKKPSC